MKPVLPVNVYRCSTDIVNVGGLQLMLAYEQWGMPDMLSQAKRCRAEAVPRPASPPRKSPQTLSTDT